LIYGSLGIAGVKGRYGGVLVVLPPKHHEKSEGGIW